MNRRDFFENVAENWDKNVGANSCSPIHKLRKIIEIADIRKGEKVLDVGTGTGILLPLLMEAVGEKGKATALDISFNMLKRASKKNKHLFSYVQADAGAIPLAESVFDKVICFSVFPHFSDKEKALSEIFRTLKNKGKLLIAHSESREKINALHRKIGGVVENDCIPKKQYMIELLEGVGFTNTAVTDNEDCYLASGIKVIHSQN